MFFVDSLVELLFGYLLVVPIVVLSCVTAYFWWYGVDPATWVFTGLLALVASVTAVASWLDSR